MHEQNNKEMDFKARIKEMSKAQGVRTFKEIYDRVAQIGEGSPSRKSFDKYLLEPRKMSLIMFWGLVKVSNVEPNEMAEMIMT